MYLFYEWLLTQRHEFRSQLLSHLGRRQTVRPGAAPVDNPCDELLRFSLLVQEDAVATSLFDHHSRAMWPATLNPAARLFERVSKPSVSEKEPPQKTRAEMA
uniref:Uncharacterized protein n=2 Tax=Prorocentrum micans TaxID=2945 RepID=A0A7S2X5L7_PROMC